MILQTRTLHKALSMLLTVAMMLNVGLTAVFAEGIPIGASELTDWVRYGVSTGNPRLKNPLALRPMLEITQ